MAITITIDEENVLKMLVDRVKDWTDDEDTIELFEQYYDHMVYGGCFEGRELDVMSIVDNDYCNNTSIMTREEYEKAREDYIKEYMDLDGFSDEDRPKREDFGEDEQDDFEEELADFEREKEEALQDYEDNTPTFDDLEIGEIPSGISDFMDGYYIEAKTSSAILISY